MDETALTAAPGAYVLFIALDEVLALRETSRPAAMPTAAAPMGPAV